MKVKRASSIKIRHPRPSTGRTDWTYSFRVGSDDIKYFFKCYDIELSKEEVLPLVYPLVVELAAISVPRNIIGSIKGDTCLYLPLVRKTLREFYREVLCLGEITRDLLDTSITIGATRKSNIKKVKGNRKILLGFSGGKDSIYSFFYYINKGYEVIPVLVNEGDRSWQDLRKWNDVFVKMSVKPILVYLNSNNNSLYKKYNYQFRSSYLIGKIFTVLSILAKKLSISAISMGLESTPDKGYTKFNGNTCNHLFQKSKTHIKIMKKYLLDPYNVKFHTPISSQDELSVLRSFQNIVPKKFHFFSTCGSSTYQSKNCSKCDKCIFTMVLMLSDESLSIIAKQIFKTKYFIKSPLKYLDKWYSESKYPPLGCVGSSTALEKALVILVANNTFSEDVNQFIKRSNIRRINC